MVVRVSNYDHFPTLGKADERFGQGSQLNYKTRRQTLKDLSVIDCESTRVQKMVAFFPSAQRFVFSRGRSR
jgi:hypothetical protein